MVLYRDDDVLVLNKPSGLPVVGTGTGTGNANAAAPSLSAMLASLTFHADAPWKPPLTIVHRLDKDASGCVVLARRAVAARTLARAFAAKSAAGGEGAREEEEEGLLGGGRAESDALYNIERTYWALVAGRPSRDEGVIRAPLRIPGKRNGNTKRRDGGVVFFADDATDERRARLPRPPDVAPGGGGGASEGRVEATTEDDPRGVRAVTSYRVIGEVPRDADGDGGDDGDDDEKVTHPRPTLLELKLSTGRKHQIRVHLASALGTPVVGDYKYGYRDTPRTRRRREIAPPAWMEALRDVEAAARRGSGTIGDPASAAAWRARRSLALADDDGGGVPLHLHARSLRFPKPSGGDVVRVVAPLPPHLASALERLGVKVSVENGFRRR